MTDERRQRGTVRVKTGTVAIVDPHVLAAALDISVMSVEDALKELTAKGEA